MDVDLPLSIQNPMLLCSGTPSPPFNPSSLIFPNPFSSANENLFFDGSAPDARVPNVSPPFDSANWHLGNNASKSQEASGSFNQPYEKNASSDISPSFSDEENAIFVNQPLSPTESKNPSALNGAFLTTGFKIRNSSQLHRFEGLSNNTQLVTAASCTRSLSVALEGAQKPVVNVRRMPSFAEPKSSLRPMQVNSVPMSSQATPINNVTRIVDCTRLNNVTPVRDPPQPHFNRQDGSYWYCPSSNSQVMLWSSGDYNVLATTTPNARPKINKKKKATLPPLDRFYPKPTYSYSCLIAMAMKNSHSGQLPVSDIYKFMMENFPYFQSAPDGWKNSVRHNLSLNKCFEKVDTPAIQSGQKKGCLWTLNPAKIRKMEEEIIKCRKKDPILIKESMSAPNTQQRLEELERGLWGSERFEDVTDQFDFSNSPVDDVSDSDDSSLRNCKTAVDVLDVDLNSTDSETKQLIIQSRDPVLPSVDGLRQSLDFQTEDWDDEDLQFSSVTNTRAWSRTTEEGLNTSGSLEGLLNASFLQGPSGTNDGDNSLSATPLPGHTEHYTLKVEVSPHHVC